MYIREFFERIVATSNRLSLAYKLEYPEAWPDFERQQSESHYLTEFAIIIILGIVIMMSCTIPFMLYAGSCEPGMSIGFAVGFYFVAIRALHEPILDLLGVNNYHTLVRGYRSAKLLGHYHKTSATEEFRSAWQVDAQVLNRNYKNDLLEGKLDRIIRAAYQHQNKALLATAMDYVDSQKARGFLGGVTIWRRPMGFIPAEVPDDRPQVMFSQNMQSDNEFLVNTNDRLDTSYSSIKSELVRARSLISQLYVFNALTDRLKDLSLASPLNAKILAYHDFSSTGTNASFSEQEANFLLNLNQIDQNPKGRVLP